MKKILVVLMLLMVIPAAVNAAIINVTKANYIIVNVNLANKSFGVDLVQNGAKNTRTEVRLNRDAHCWHVHRSGRADTPMGMDEFMNSLHKGTRVCVTGGRAWDGKINASDVWAEN